MKKVAIFSMAAFYLLLTTGMFVCIVHCAAQKIIMNPIAMHMEHSDMAKPGDKKHCKDDGGCGCCNKHGNYVIKENLKPGFELQFTPTVVAAMPRLLVADNALPYITEINQTSRAAGKAPPWKSGRLISIQFHSLQI